MNNQAQYNSENAEVQGEGAGSPEDGVWIINPKNWSGMAGTFLERDFPVPLIRHHDTFYQWVGTKYDAVPEADIRQMVYRFLGSAYTMSKETDENGETVTVRRRFYADDRAVNKLLDALRSLVHVSETLRAPTWLPAAIDEQCKHDPRDLMACQNGLLDLKTGELLPHSPAFLSMNAVEYVYDPKAKASTWDKFVREVLPDEDARNTLQQEMGYLISNDTRHQKIFAHIGERRSGKGTIAYVLKLLIGPENVVNPTLENLKQHFGLASLID
jgi:putative DNA primase/helicase